MPAHLALMALVQACHSGRPSSCKLADLTSCWALFLPAASCARARPPRPRAVPGGPCGLDLPPSGPCRGRCGPAGGRSGRPRGRRGRGPWRGRRRAWRALVEEGAGLVVREEGAVGLEGGLPAEGLGPVRGWPWTWAQVEASVNSALSAHSRARVQAPVSPSRASSAARAAWGWWRFFHPSRQTLLRWDQR